MQIGKKQVVGGLFQKTTPTPVLQPTVIPTSGETVNWKVYRNEDVTFRYPTAWVEEPNLIRGSGFSQVFKDPEGRFIFSFSSNGNYNQLTGRPYVTIDDFL